MDIVKGFMKKCFRTYRKGRGTLPLEGGGERVGVKGERPDGRSKKSQEILY
jgi:hypothetical protein